MRARGVVESRGNQSVNRAALPSPPNRGLSLSGKYTASQWHSLHFPPEVSKNSFNPGVITHFFYISTDIYRSYRHLPTDTLINTAQLQRHRLNRCRRRSRLELSVTDSGASQKELPSGCLPGSGLFRSSPIFEIESAARVGGAVGGIQKRCICELQEPCAVSRTSGGGSRGEVPAL